MSNYKPGTLTRSQKKQMRKFQYAHGIRTKQNPLTALFLVATLLMAGLVAKDYVSAQHSLQVAKTQNLQVTEATDIQPAAGYKVINDTYNPQGE